MPAGAVRSAVVLSLLIGQITVIGGVSRRRLAAVSAHIGVPGLLARTGSVRASTRPPRSR